MKRKIKILLFLLFSLSLNSYAQDSSYRVIRLYQNEIALSVPSNWQIKGKALDFAVYEIKYSVAVQDKKNQSGVSLYVYGQQYGPKMQIKESIVQDNIQGMLSDPVRKIAIEKSGLKIISGLKVGFIKYTYRVKTKSIFSRSYGIEMFFCNEKNIYYKIEIRGLNKSVDEFRPIAERVFESLSIQ